MKISPIPQGGNWKNIPTGLLNFRKKENKHNNLYRRLNWDSCAPTISHIRKTMLIHPLFNRTLSAREGARLQGFDDTYHFWGTKDEVFQQLADAVSPIMSECFAKHIKNYLLDS